MADLIAKQQPFLVYMNMERGLRITYPAGWTRQEQTAAAGFVAQFFSPQEDASDRFSENLNVVIEPLPPGVTVEQYVQGGLQAMSQAPFRFLEKEWVLLGGHRAYRHVYTGPMATPVPMSGKCLQYVMVENSKAFVVTYTAELAKYDKFLPAIQQMIDSLEIG